MLFNSNIFLLAFLPVTLAGYHAVRRGLGPRAAYGRLLAASLLFYGYWDVRYLALLVGSIAVNALLARAIIRGRSRRMLLAGVIFNLALLGVFKYLTFFANSFAALTGIAWAMPHIVLPIGISFYTFQQIAFLVDAQRGEVGRFGLVPYALFVCFFPQLIAGPIVHHNEMMAQFERHRDGEAVWRLFAVGLTLFALGLVKKVCVADTLALSATPVFDAARDGLGVNFFTAWTGALAYTLQLYFDFSGYSDMALGLGLMFGARLPGNFNSPYKATSISDFWRRWHITLSRFLRDYLYIPLGGNRRGPVRQHANLMTVMVLGGLWHGAGWTFALWGALHGLYLGVNHFWSRCRPRAWVGVPAYDVGCWALTMLAVVLAWVTFRAETFGAAWTLYRAMLGLDGLALPVEAEPALAALGLGGLTEHVTFFAENARRDFYLGLLAIAGAGAIAVLGPNSIQLLRRFRPCTNFDELAAAWPKEARPPRRGSGQAPTRAWWLPRGITTGIATAPRWALTDGFAVVTGLMLFAALRLINAAAETEFLYFQF